MVSVWVYVAVMGACYPVCVALAWVIYKKLYRPTITDRALLALPMAAFVYCAARQAFTIVHYNTNDHIPFGPYVFLTVSSDISGSTLSTIYAVLTLVRLSVMSGVYFTPSRTRFYKLAILSFGIIMNGSATLVNLFMIVIPQIVVPDTFWPFPMYTFLGWNVFIAVFDLGVNFQLVRMLVRAKKNLSLTVMLQGTPAHEDGKAAVSQGTKSTGSSVQQQLQDQKFVSAKNWIYVALGFYAIGMAWGIVFAIGREEGLGAAAAVLGYIFQIMYLAVLTHALRLIYKSS